MPVYTYTCPGCDKSREIIKPTKLFARVEICSKCNLGMFRDFRADLPHAQDKDYARPIHSDSLAINPCQRDEHKKMFPDVRLDDQCRPVFESFRQHDSYLEKCNMRKPRQKVRNRGKKLR